MEWIYPAAALAGALCCVLCYRLGFRDGLMALRGKTPGAPGRQNRRAADAVMEHEENLQEQLNALANYQPEHTGK